MRDVIDVSSPGQLTRRRFVRLTGGGILALPLGLSLLTEACSSVPPGSSAATSGSVAASAKVVYPTYVPFTNVPKPDLPGSPEGVEDAYTAYPSQRTSLNLSAPGNGGSLSAFVTTSVAPPKPLEQNPALAGVQQAGEHQSAAEHLDHYRRRDQTANHHCRQRSS